LFKTERMAQLLIVVLRSCVRSGKINAHGSVVMPDHLHVLMTVPGDMSIEKAVQLIKAGFSFRAANADFFGSSAPFSLHSTSGAVQWWGFWVEKEHSS
jgi:REP element-mobilizing transposase RayT